MRIIFILFSLILLSLTDAKSVSKRETTVEENSHLRTRRQEQPPQLTGIEGPTKAQPSGAINNAPVSAPQEQGQGQQQQSSTPRYPQKRPKNRYRPRFGGFNRNYGYTGNSYYNNENSGFGQRNSFGGSNRYGSGQQNFGGDYYARNQQKKQRKYQNNLDRQQQKIGQYNEQMPMPRYQSPYNFGRQNSFQRNQSPW